MPRVLNRPEVINDLEHIWRYAAQDSPPNADKFLDRIQESCVTLANFPRMGTKRDDLQANLRSHPVGHYLIFYFPLEEGIDIVRILHSSRDMENHG